MPSTYRTPDPTRIANQLTDLHLTHLGQPATWRQWVSASTGANPAVAGFDVNDRFIDEHDGIVGGEAR